MLKVDTGVHIITYEIIESQKCDCEKIVFKEKRSFSDISEQLFTDYCLCKLIRQVYAERNKINSYKQAGYEHEPMARTI